MSEDFDNRLDVLEDKVLSDNDRLMFLLGCVRGELPNTYIHKRINFTFDLTNIESSHILEYVASKFRLVGYEQCQLNIQSALGMI